MLQGDDHGYGYQSVDCRFEEQAPALVQYEQVKEWHGVKEWHTAHDQGLGRLTVLGRRRLGLYKDRGELIICDGRGQSEGCRRGKRAEHCDVPGHGKRRVGHAGGYGGRFCEICEWYGAIKRMVVPCMLWWRVCEPSAAMSECDCGQTIKRTRPRLDVVRDACTMLCM